MSAKRARLELGVALATAIILGGIYIFGQIPGIGLFNQIRSIAGQVLPDRKAGTGTFREGVNGIAIIEIDEDFEPSPETLDQLDLPVDAVECEPTRAPPHRTRLDILIEPIEVSLSHSAGVFVDFILPPVFSETCNLRIHDLRFHSYLQNVPPDHVMILQPLAKTRTGNHGVTPYLTAFHDLTSGIEWVAAYASGRGDQSYAFAEAFLVENGQPLANSPFAVARKIGPVSDPPRKPVAIEVDSIAPGQLIPIETDFAIVDKYSESPGPIVRINARDIHDRKVLERIANRFWLLTLSGDQTFDIHRSIGGDYVTGDEVLAMAIVTATERHAVAESPVRLRLFAISLALVIFTLTFILDRMRSKVFVTNITLVIIVASVCYATTWVLMAFGLAPWFAVELVFDAAGLAVAMTLVSGTITYLRRLLRHYQILTLGAGICICGLSGPIEAADSSREIVRINPPDAIVFVSEPGKSQFIATVGTIVGRSECLMFRGGGQVSVTMADGQTIYGRDGNIKTEAWECSALRQSSLGTLILKMNWFRKYSFRQMARMSENDCAVTASPDILGVPVFDPHSKQTIGPGWRSLVVSFQGPQKLGTATVALLGRDGRVLARTTTQGKAARLPGVSFTANELYTLQIKTDIGLLTRELQVAALPVPPADVQAAGADTVAAWLATHPTGMFRFEALQRLAALGSLTDELRRLAVLIENGSRLDVSLEELAICLSGSDR